MVNASLEKRYGLTMPITQTLRATFKAAAVVVLVLAPAASRAQVGMMIEEATYGLNCGAKRNNAYNDIYFLCYHTKNCSYRVNDGRIDDHAPGCRKNYIVKWVCPYSDQIFQKVISPEASGREIKLSCGEEAPPIKVQSATYGENCGATKGNATQDLKAQCNEQRACNYQVNHQVLGNPAVGCAKTYQFSYQCGSKQFQGDLPAEADGRSVHLSCD